MEVRKLGLVALVLSLLPYPSPIMAQALRETAWPTDFSWRLDAYDTLVSFADVLYCDAWGYDERNNTGWWWYNVSVGSVDELVKELGIGIQDANATVHYFNKDGEAKVILSAPTDIVSVLTLHYGEIYPSTVKVMELGIQDTEFYRVLSDWEMSQAPSVYLNESSKVLKLKVLHHSDMTVLWYWAGLKPPPISPGGSDDIIPPIVDTDVIEEQVKDIIKQPPFPWKIPVAVAGFILVYYFFAVTHKPKTKSLFKGKKRDRKPEKKHFKKQEE